MRSHLRFILCSTAPSLLLMPGVSMAIDPACEQRLRAAVQICEKIPEYQSATGMIFNPPGFRQYYERSHCLQRTAIDTREESLCEKVKRRYSLFLDGSQVSRESCTDKVNQKKVEDRQEFLKAREAIPNNPQKLFAPVAAELVPSPDRRVIKSLDLRLTLEGEFPHFYAIEALAQSAPESEADLTPTTIISLSTYLGALEPEAGLRRRDQLLYSLPHAAFEKLMSLDAAVRQLKVAIRVWPEIPRKVCERTDYAGYDPTAFTRTGAFKVQRSW